MQRLHTLGVLVCIAGLGIITGCGGGNDAVPAAPESGSSAAPRSVEYDLVRRGDIGIRQAFLTLIERTDGQTTALIDFYVPQTPEVKGLVHSAALHDGNCFDLGEVEQSFGELSPGLTTTLIDRPYDDLVSAFDEDRAVVAIMAPDGKSVAWCGP